MALVLRLRPGQDFYVVDEQIVVSRITGFSSFELLVSRTGRKMEITEDEMAELKEIPDVWIASGGRAQSGLAKVTIEAPREIQILRGDIYRGETKHGEAQVVWQKPKERWA